MTKPVDYEKQRKDRKVLAENAILGEIFGMTDLKSNSSKVKDLAEAYSILRSAQ